MKRLDNVVHFYCTWPLLLSVRQRTLRRCRQRKNSPRDACSCCFCLHKLVVSSTNRSGLVIKKGGCAEMAAEHILSCQEPFSHSVCREHVFTSSHPFSLSLLCPPDLISKLMDSTSNPWLENENCYNLVSVPETYTGPRLSFPLSVSDMNALLAAFKEQQVQNMTLLKLNCFGFSFHGYFLVCPPKTLHARYVLQLLYETRKLLKQMPNIIHFSTTYTKEITICGRWLFIFFFFF